MRRFVVVGGGAGGVLLAVHLLRHRPEGLIVMLIEKRPDLGAGVASRPGIPNTCSTSALPT